MSVENITVSQDALNDAARDMYQALKGAMVIIGTVPWPDGDECRPLREALERRRQAIIKAIAKAEGRTPWPPSAAP